MLDLLGGLDRVHGIERRPGTVEIEVAIPEIGLAPALRKLLQIAARADVVLPFGTRDAGTLQHIRPFWRASMYNYRPGIDSRGAG